MTADELVKAMKPLEGQVVQCGAFAYTVVTVRKLAPRDRINRDDTVILDSGKDVLHECRYVPSGFVFASRDAKEVVPSASGGLIIRHKNGIDDVCLKVMEVLL